MSEPSATPRRTAVYVANADSRDITVLALDRANGALLEVERFAAGGCGRCRSPRARTGASFTPRSGASRFAS